MTINFGKSKLTFDARSSSPSFDADKIKFPYDTVFRQSSTSPDPVSRHSLVVVIDIYSAFQVAGIFYLAARFKNEHFSFIEVDYRG